MLAKLFLLFAERNYKIDTAIEMPEAYKQEQNDPYIIDSIKPIILLMS